MKLTTNMHKLLLLCFDEFLKVSLIKRSMRFAIELTYSLLGYWDIRRAGSLVHKKLKYTAQDHYTAAKHHNFLP